MEQWLDIEGYEDYYQVSNYGRVRSVDRVVAYKDGRKIKHKGGVLKPSLVGGYEFINLCNNSKDQLKPVHRLVAETFIPNPKNKLEVNHKDLNKQHNFVSNLEWNTRQENMQHAHKNGVKFGSDGFKGKKHSEEAKQKMSNVSKSKRFIEEHNQNVSMVM